MVTFLFDKVGFNRLEARCNDNNPGSYRVMTSSDVVNTRTLDEMMMNFI